MVNERLVRSSDGATIDLKDQEAEQAETTARAKRTIMTDDSGNIFSSSADTARTTNTNIIPVQVVDPVGRVSKTDGTTAAAQVIDYPHHEIHGGSRFFYTEFITLASVNDTRELLLVTPDTTKWAHFTFEVGSNKEIGIELFEATTTSADGTALTEVNRNRNSATTSTTTLTHTPTITDDGTRIVHSQVGATGGFFVADIGGLNGERVEIILKQNTKYLLRVTANDTGCDVNFKLDWYEHTDS